MPIVVKDLHYTYEAPGAAPVKALQGVGFTVEEGEIVVIVGPGGAGKSTLLLHLNGLLMPPPDTVWVDGYDVGRGGVALAAVREKVGTVLQFPERQLFADTVADDVAFGPRQLGRSPAHVRHAVTRALADVGLELETVGARSPFTLSGGQRRRIALAGVLAMGPKYLVLDEPTAGLDGPGRRALWGLLQQLRSRDGTAVVVVSHDMDEAARHADKVVVLHEGRVALTGSPQTVFTSGHRDLLLNIGLALPVGGELIYRLALRGWPVPSGARDEEAAATAVAEALRGRG